ncbi:MAG: hypothetical protein GXW94_15035 [Serratia liquefaciens]|nr:hypothetical protein [Serratia liquefaciens]
MRSYEKKKRKLITAKIVNTLSQLCTLKNISPDTPPEQWISTREIADQCQLGIYQARYFLIILEGNNLVVSTSKSIKNSLRWRIKNQKTN